MAITSTSTINLSERLEAIDPRPENDAPVDLDWEGFQAGSFPGRRPRHDFQAVVAYWKQKDDGQGTPIETPPPGHPGAEHDRRGGLSDQPVLDTWETEGGLPHAEGEAADDCVGPMREVGVVLLGTVKTFNRSSGHGFIVPDDGGEHLWVHARNVESDLTKLREGERVEFMRREAGMGAEAVDVRSTLPPAR